MDLINYIYDECHRQHVTNYGDFADSWDWAKKNTGQPFLNPTQFGTFVQELANKCEPNVNAWRNVAYGTHDNLRTSHVGFMYGGNAAPVGEVRERFHRWCEGTYQLLTMEYDCSVKAQDIDSLIRALLQIHPWADGNGRTASILRNWMLGTLDNPTPLPDYQF